MQVKLPTSDRIYFARLLSLYIFKYYFVFVIPSADMVDTYKLKTTNLQCLKSFLVHIITYITIVLLILSFNRHNFIVC